MSIDDVLKHKVKLVFHSEISGAYVQYCTLESFFKNEVWKEKRLLSARLDGVSTNKGSYQSTGPR